MESSPEFWRKCSSCRKPIAFLARYHVCTVSTCNKKRVGYVFCSVPCWDQHVPVLNHRNAWSEERRAPSKAEWAREQAEAAGTSPAPAPVSHINPPPPTLITRASQRTAEASPPPASPRVIVPAPVAARTMSEDESQEDVSTDDILVVASKLKAYIKARSGMNTSASVLEVLSDRIRSMADDAIEAARAEGRKTVLDRDFPER